MFFLLIPWMKKISDHPVIKRLYNVENDLLKLNNNEKFVFYEITN